MGLLSKKCVEMFTNSEAQKEIKIKEHLGNARNEQLNKPVF